MDLCTQLKTPDFDGECKEYTYSRDRAFLRFLPDSEDPMNDEPFQDHLHPFITLGVLYLRMSATNCSMIHERRGIDYLVIRPGSQ